MGFKPLQKCHCKFTEEGVYTYTHPLPPPLCLNKYSASWSTCHIRTMKEVALQFSGSQGILKILPEKIKLYVQYYVSGGQL